MTSAPRLVNRSDSDWNDVLCQPVNALTRNDGVIWRSGRNHTATRSSFASNSGFIRRDAEPPASTRVSHPPANRFSNSAAIRFRPPQVIGKRDAAVAARRFGMRQARAIRDTVAAVGAEERKEQQARPPAPDDAGRLVGIAGPLNRHRALVDQHDDDDLRWDRSATRSASSRRRDRSASSRAAARPRVPSRRARPVIPISRPASRRTSASGVATLPRTWTSARTSGGGAACGTRRAVRRRAAITASNHDYHGVPRRCHRRHDGTEARSRAASRRPSTPAALGFVRKSARRESSP